MFNLRAIFLLFPAEDISFSITILHIRKVRRGLSSARCSGENLGSPIDQHYFFYVLEKLVNEKSFFND